MTPSSNDVEHPLMVAKSRTLTGRISCSRGPTTVIGMMTEAPRPAADKHPDDYGYEDDDGIASSSRRHRPSSTRGGRATLSM